MNQLFLMDTNDVALLLLGVCVIPIAILIILAIIFRLRSIKKKNANKEVVPDEEQKDIFLEAYGGKDNIDSIDFSKFDYVIDCQDTTTTKILLIKKFFLND